MDTLIRLYFIDGVSLVDEGVDGVSVQAPPHTYRAPLSLSGTTAGLRSALDRLSGEGASLQALATEVLESDGPAGGAKLMQTIGTLERHALLGRRLVVDGALLASIEPLSNYFRYDEQRVQAGETYVLSRFAYCRNNNGRMVLESPLGHAVIGLHATTAHSAVHLLTRPCDSVQMAKRIAGLGEAGAAHFMSFLANAEALVPSDPQTGSPEDEDPVRAPWEFHDLVFHTRSRLGRHSNPFGGTYAYEGKFDSLPAIKPPMSDEIVQLYKPDLERLADEDERFTRVLETRRSLREQGDPPINDRQLGEFLYRSARVQQLVESSGVSFRPYPAGGALHELEIYPLVNSCDGLSPGLYHYNPLEHHLCRIREPDRILRTLSLMAARTVSLDHPPQVVLIITARFQRVQLKYQTVSYSLIMKNVGGLFQTMYLVAIAMGLAPCALGGGDSDLFASAAGLDYLAETSVGEFVLGSSRG
ncbi:MAG: SagB/ThcOx family dehydrogenase [Gemmatimonadales bacterium]|nr:SagB/ThcOx family dehydrogenase [Gemmatimonadales bacterium]